MQSRDSDEGPRCAARLRERGTAARLQGQTREALALALRAKALLGDAFARNGELLLLIGNCLADLGQYGDADETLGLSASVFWADGRYSEYAQAMICRGRVIAEQGEDAEAIKFFLGLVDLELPLFLKSQVLNNLGVLYRRAQQLDVASEFLGRDIEICERAGDDRGAAIAYLNLAAVRFEADDRKGGRKYALQAARLFDARDMDDLAAQAKALARAS